MRIYTRTGDDGTTGLIGGKRISKADLLVECTGTIDELNATIGLAAVDAPLELVQRLAAIQAELFIIGAQISNPDGRAANLPNLDDSTIARLESEIDTAEAELQPLANFILPGGCPCSARLHLSRAVCRRAERIAVTLSRRQERMAMPIRYLNRLSDWLFVQARWANRKAGVADVLWRPAE